MKIGDRTVVQFRKYKGRIAVEYRGVIVGQSRDRDQWYVRRDGWDRSYPYDKDWCHPELNIETQITGMNQALATKTVTPTKNDNVNCAVPAGAGGL